MTFHCWMPHAVDGDVMQSVPLVVLQIEVHEVLHGSALYGWNGQDA
jgi:hypothetical protein